MLIKNKKSKRKLSILGMQEETSQTILCILKE